MNLFPECFYESIHSNAYSLFGGFHPFSMKALRYISFLQNSFSMPALYTALLPLYTLGLSVFVKSSNSELCHQEPVF